MHCLQIYILPLAVALFTHLHICRWLLHCLRICIFAARCYIVYEFSTHFLFCVLTFLPHDVDFVFGFTFCYTMLQRLRIYIFAVCFCITA